MKKHINYSEVDRVYSLLEKLEHSMSDVMELAPIVPDKDRARWLFTQLSFFRNDVLDMVSVLDDSLPF